MSDFEAQIRYGGPQTEDASEAQRKAEEREAKKAEVRKRLEEEGKKGKKKKGFLTPERKKKLRKLLMMKAAEDLKQQQLKKEKERQKALADRVVPLPNVDGIDDHAQLEKIYNDIWSRVVKLEEEKYDINQVVQAVESEINELTIAVNDLRGKFVKPTLKKVSKYDNRFKKLAESKKPEEKADFRSNLKVVKKENVFTQLAAKKKQDKPEWSVKEAGKKEKKKEEAAPVEEPEPEEAPAAEPVEEEHEEVEEEEEEEEEE